MHQNALELFCEFVDLFKPYMCQVSIRKCKSNLQVSLGDIDLFQSRYIADNISILLVSLQTYGVQDVSARKYIAILRYLINITLYRDISRYIDISIKTKSIQYRNRFQIGIAIFDNIVISPKLTHKVSLQLTIHNTFSQPYVFSSRWSILMILLPLLSVFLCVNTLANITYCKCCTILTLFCFCSCLGFISFHSFNVLIAPYMPTINKQKSKTFHWFNKFNTNVTLCWILDSNYDD